MRRIAIAALFTVLALAAARNNDRVGVAFATDRVEHYVAPAKGRRQALRVISDLLSYSFSDLVKSSR